jgi:fibronectin type 3 domain-containing protein
LNASTTYYYKVDAENSTGSSAQSSSVSVTTPAPTPLATPTGLEASVFDTLIQLSWNAVPLAASYEVYRSTSANGSYSMITSTSGAGATDTSPRTGTSYYKVKAIPSSLTNLTESSLSAYISVTK